MIDLPKPPVCIEVVKQVRTSFKDWKAVGVFENLGVILYVYKLEDTGSGATYARTMFTPYIFDVVKGQQDGWELVERASCLRDGTPIFNLRLIEIVNEQI